jgi:hypothetical protein
MLFSFFLFSTPVTKFLSFNVLINIINTFLYPFISGVQMKSWAGELETVNCFAFLKCKLTVVIRACGQLT